jgi:hypothetical protein
VHLGATTVVGLKGALAHWRTPGTTSATPTGRPQRPSYGTGASQSGQTHGSAGAACRGRPRRHTPNHKSRDSRGCLAVIGVALLTFGPPSPTPPTDGAAPPHGATSPDGRPSVRTQAVDDGVDDRARLVRRSSARRLPAAVGRS